MRDDVLLEIMVMVGVGRGGVVCSAMGKSVLRLLGRCLGEKSR